jgi:AAA domain
MCNLPKPEKPQSLLILRGSDDACPRTVKERAITRMETRARLLSSAAPAGLLADMRRRATDPAVTPWSEGREWLVSLGPTLRGTSGENRPDILRSLSALAAKRIREGFVQHQDAVDALYDAALTSGLVEEFGEDTVQHILAAGLKSASPLLDDREPQKPSRPPSAGNRARALSQARSRWQQTIVNASELQGMAFPPVAYVLPGYIPEGVTILAGKPKIGKSWLTLDLCIATAAGRFTLGTLKPPQGDVLYLALEDSQRRVKQRLKKILPPFDAKWPERLHIATEWHRADEGGVADIEAWCDTVERPILIVIDTLEKIRPVQNGKSQAYSADYQALSGLHKIANQRGVAIVINHHVRKMDADDPFDTISGTLGLTGAADTLLVLRRQSGRVTLHARGRDIEESETAVQFEKSTCRWSILGAAAEVHVSNERADILGALKSFRPAGDRDGMSVAEIMASTESHNRNATDILLSKMVRTGEIVRVRRGFYVIAKHDGKIELKERNEDQLTDFTNESTNLSDLSDLSKAAPRAPQIVD